MLHVYTKGSSLNILLWRMVYHRVAYLDLYFLYFIQMTYQIPLNTAKQYYSLMTAQLYATENNSADLFENVNEDLSHLTDWFRAN